MAADTKIVELNEKAIKQVAQKIITFLAQIENFQKKMWLKNL